MNKTELSQVLAEETGLAQEQAFVVMDAIENHFFFSKKNDSVISAEIADRLDMSIEDADKQLAAGKDVLYSAMKEKLSSPFKKLA